MPVDESVVTDNTSVDSGASVTCATAPASADTQTSAAPHEAGASAENGVAQPGAATQPNRAGSSATPNAIPQNPQNAQPGTKPPAATADWQKRYSDLQSESQRRLNAIEAQRRQETQELDQLRRFRQEQAQQAERQKLPVWSKQNPEYSKFQATKQKVDVVKQQLRSIDQNLPPEQQKALRQSILSAVTPDEEQTLLAHQQQSEQFVSDLVGDPVGTLAPIIQQFVQQGFDQYRMHQQADAAVTRDFDQLKPIIEQHGPELQQLLERKVPYDVAIENVKLKAQLGALQNRVGEADQARGAALEQQRLAKGQASITRDPVSTSKPDLYSMAKKEAAEKGIRMDDPRFMGIISRLEKTLKTTI